MKPKSNVFRGGKGNETEIKRHFFGEEKGNETEIKRFFGEGTGMKGGRYYKYAAGKETLKMLKNI